MATYSVTDYVATWTTGALVATADATTYATARSWADWAAATSGAKDAAILEASTWLRAFWRPPCEYDEDADAQIEDAVIEASRLSLSAPLMGGNDAALPVKIREKIGPLEDEWEPVNAQRLRNDRLALINAMLRAAGARGGAGGVNVSLAKS